MIDSYTGGELALADCFRIAKDLISLWVSVE